MWCQTYTAASFKSLFNFNNKRNWSFDPVFPDIKVRCFQKSFDHLFCSAFFFIPFDVSGWFFKQKFKLNLNETIWFSRPERVFTNMKETVKQAQLFSWKEVGGRGLREEIKKIIISATPSRRLSLRAHCTEGQGLCIQQTQYCYRFLLPTAIL